jgi:L-threonylcarbamoyladenylate synthase
VEHIAKDGRVGLRVIDHPIMEELSRAVNVPLTATSANISGQEACSTAACVQKQLTSPLLGYIIDGGQLSATASTIARLQDGRIDIIRQGVLELT